jgi:hypothetical protein
MLAFRENLSMFCTQQPNADIDPKQHQISGRKIKSFQLRASSKPMPNSAEHLEAKSNDDDASRKSQAKARAMNLLHSFLS